MSYYYENRLLRIFIGQFYMVVYAILASWLGVSFKTFALIIVLMILTSYLQSRFFKGNPISSVKASMEEVMGARKLVEERNLREIQAKDEGLVNDMQAQLRFTTLMMMGTLFGMIYFFIVWRHVPGLYEFIRGYLDNDFISHVLAFLLYLEGFFLISQLSTEIALRRVGRIIMISMPNEYIVTVKGIVIKGILSNTVIAFPLESHVRTVLNEKRGFVDIVNEGRKSSSILRFYSRDPRRLYDIIRRYGFEKA